MDGESIPKGMLAGMVAKRQMDFLRGRTDGKL